MCRSGNRKGSTVDACMRCVRDLEGDWSAVVVKGKMMALKREKDFRNWKCSFLFFLVMITRSLKMRRCLWCLLLLNQ